LGSFATLAIAPTFAVVARATTLRALSLEDLVAASDRAVVGRAVHHDSDWAYVAGARRIVTWTRVLQEDDLLGESGAQDEVLVMTLGGKVGDLRQKVPGEATLTLGERVLLFTSAAASDGACHIVGMSQGKYEIVAGQSGGDGVLRRSAQIPHLVRAQPKPGFPPAPLAIEVLAGKSLKDARTLVRGVR